MSRSLLLAALALAAVPAPVSATEMMYDPVESEMVARPGPGNPANAEAAARDHLRYSETVRVWDPVDSTFVSVAVAPDREMRTAIATHGREPVSYRLMWDPAEEKFVRMPVY